MKDMRSGGSPLRISIEIGPVRSTPPKFVEWVVERFFNMLQSRVYKLGRPKDLPQLKKCITKDLKDPFWFRWCSNVFDSIPQRMIDVSEQEGWQTNQ